MIENLLIVFVKYPYPGRVKHRLSKHIGKVNAAKIYKEIAETIVKRIIPLKGEHYTVEICFTPKKAEKLVKEWLAYNAHFSHQQGNSLGKRMLNSINYAFDSGYKKVTLIGTDCPDISCAIIMESFELLHSKDVVLGPAYDGGYYLIGLTKSIPRLFHGIEWGTKRVLQQTITKISLLKLSFGLLPMLRDIDRVEDLKYYRNS